MKQNAEPYELVYTVKQEDDLYSPLKEGNVDRLDEEMKATLLAYWGKASRVKEQEADFTLRIVAEEGTIDETRLKKAFQYWSLELEAEHRAQSRFNLRGALLIFLAGCVFISLAFLLGDSENAFLETMLEIMGSVAIWELAYALLITYPSTHLRYRKFQQFSQHCRIVVSTPA